MTGPTIAVHYIRSGSVLAALSQLQMLYFLCGSPCGAFDLYKARITLMPLSSRRSRSGRMATWRVGGIRGSKRPHHENLESDRSGGDVVTIQ